MNPLCSTLHKIRGIATIDLEWVVIDMNSFTVQLFFAGVLKLCGRRAHTSS